jgi:hypothetical protein
MLPSLLSFGLACLLVSGPPAAQQTPSQTPHKSSHNKSAKHRSSAGKPDAEPPTRVEVFNGSRSQTQVFNAQPPANAARRGAHPVPAMTRVDVYNGTSKQMQIFSAEPSAGAKTAKSSRGKASRSQRNTVAMAPVSDVEIFNGTTKERRIFSEAPNETSGGRNRQPVVVGISSSASEAKGNNAPRVVTAIVTNGSGDGGNPQPVTGVSPLPPKRPPYHPMSPDAQ